VNIYIFIVEAKETQADLSKTSHGSNSVSEPVIMAIVSGGAKLGCTLVALTLQFGKRMRNDAGSARRGLEHPW
jgi:hypothetical protein